MGDMRKDYVSERFMIVSKKNTNGVNSKDLFQIKNTFCIFY